MDSARKWLLDSNSSLFPYTAFPTIATLMHPITTTNGEGFYVELFWIHAFPLVPDIVITNIYYRVAVFQRTFEDCGYAIYSLCMYGVKNYIR